MNTDLSAAPRAVVATAADLIYRVGCSMIGSEKVPTAKANAWPRCAPTGSAQRSAKRSPG